MSTDTESSFMVDPRDSWVLSSFDWRPSPHGAVTYARALAMPRRYVYMHRVIMRPESGMVVDHINGNGLDNRRCNLRVCTRQQNNQHQLRVRRDNKTGVPGVYPAQRPVGAWIAHVKRNGRTVHIGTFPTFEEATAARAAAAREAYGEFAPVYLEDAAIAGDLARLVKG